MRKKIASLEEPKDSLNKRYEQDLITYDIKLEGFNGKSDYGYNSEFDFVCISKDGTVGEIVDIQGLRVGLPKAPKDNIYLADKDIEEQYWKRPPKPTNLKKIPDMMTYYGLDESIKVQYRKYIKAELQRRSDGFWFMCNGKPYIYYWLSLYVPPVV